MDITLMSSITECNEPNAAFEKFTEICPRKLLGASTTACKRILAKHTYSNSLFWQIKFSALKARRETYQKQAKVKKLRQVLKSTEMLQ